MVETMGSDDTNLLEHGDSSSSSSLEVSKYNLPEEYAGYPDMVPWDVVKMQLDKTLPSTLKVHGDWECADAALSTDTEFQVGPAVPWLRWSAICMLATQLFIFAYIRLSSVCPETAVPSYPMLIWAITIPATILRCSAEFYAVKLLVVNYAQTVFYSNMAPITEGEQLKLAPFKVFGIETNFYMWCVVSIVFTMLNAIDMTTDTLFAATYSTILKCSAGQHITNIWRMNQRQSLFGKLNLTVDLDTIILISYLLCQLQTVIPIVMSVRKGPVVYKKGHDGKSVSCLTGEALDHEDVLEALAEANGCYSLQSLAPTEALANTICVGVEEGVGDDFLDAAHAPAEELARRVWLSLNLENMVQANLQVIVFGIGMTITGKQFTRATYQSLFSICLGIGLTVMKIDLAKSFRKLSEFVEKQFNSPDRSWDSAEEKQTLTKLKAFRKSRTSIYIGFSVLLLGLGYASAKLVAAFYCEDSMFNLTGCAHISDEEGTNVSATTMH